MKKTDVEESLSRRHEHLYKSVDKKYPLGFFI